MMMSKLFVCSSLLMASVTGHGLVKFPKSRNQFCGEEIKPDQAKSGACKEAFADDFNGGYQFMAVLTHALGRAKVKNTKHVCGFDSETWKGGATPWDKPLDWPTNKMSSGRNKIVWNIQTGPHFDDTDDFKYWITKPNFQYKVGTELTWDDFEEAPFCTLYYNDKTPNANPDVIPDKGDATFTNWCNVPQRSGHHVIYGEWGRRESTFERFHTCIDGMFGGSNPGTPQTTPTPQATGVCPLDVRKCPGGEYVSRDPKIGCNFPRCPEPETPMPQTGGCNGLLIGEYDSCLDAPNCCKEGLQCRKTTKYYAQCERPRTQAPRTQVPRTRAPHMGGGGNCRRMIPKWGNCHKKFNCCKPGLTCKIANPWYAQCL